MDASGLDTLLEHLPGPALVPWLESLGYRVLEREHGWHECLIAGNGETWTGQGLSRNEALGRALGAAFPSHGARAALLQALENATLGHLAASPAARPAPAPGPVPDKGEREAPATSVLETVPNGLPLAAVPSAGPWEIGSETDALVSPEVQASATTAGEGWSTVPPHVASDLQAEGADPSQHGDGAPLPPHLPPDVQAIPAAGPSSAVAGNGDVETAPSLPDGLSSDGIVVASDFLASSAGDVAVPRAVPVPTLLAPPKDDTAAREELQDLLAEIESRKEEFACLAPGRQRLILLGWLAKARGLQDEHPRSIPLSAEVGRLVKVLRGMSESCWPGMISAFQIRARPIDSARDLRPFAGSVPMSWTEVAEAAAEAVRQMEESDEQEGRDRDGWSDQGQLFPSPPSPDQMLQEIESEIEEFGPIGTRQPKEGPRPDPEQIGNWARRLRWLRQDATDKILWGALAGRLRYWAQEAPFEVRQLLDPTFRPGRSWATLVRSGEEEARQREELDKVLEATPPADAPDPAIVTWVGSLLPLPADHTPAILVAARPIRDRILGLELDESHFPGADRRSRRRLQKILEALRPTEGQEEEAAPTETAADLPSPGVDNEPPARLLARTRGQRVLFVSNRSDSQLQEKLQTAFEFKQLDWAEATPRRVEAATEAIAAGTYDLVVGATGFLSHKEDGRLQRVCKSAGVPYVRANRGRPGAVQLALTRDLLGSLPSDFGRLPS